MADEVQDWLNSPPSATYLLVPTLDRVKEVGNEVIEECDDRAGIQARIAIDDLVDRADTEDEALAYVLRESKVGSRWGKDLLDHYREFFESIFDSADEANLEDKLDENFSKYDEDPYESAFIGEPLSVGFDLRNELSERLNTIGSSEATFNRTDLAAAVGYTADEREINRSTVGTVLIEFPGALSEVTGSKRLSYLPNVVRELLLLGLSVVVVGPDTGTDEAEHVKKFFRSVGRFNLQELGSIGIDISKEIDSWLDSWYEGLCYDVDSGTISQSIIRAAMATALDLKYLTPPEREYAVHFVAAIKYGLQNQYSEQKLSGAHRDRFEELWDEVVKPHPNYYQYKSQRNSFPRVRVAREDGGILEFVLHHEGSLLNLHLNGVPIGDDGDPSRVLIDKIEAYLDAERIDEEQWSALVAFVENRLSELTELSSQEFVERVLLYQGYLPPANETDTVSTAERSGEWSSKEFDQEWYREHWRTILSSHRVTSQAGLRLIKNKQELMDSLSGEDVSTAALYGKLERDVERAWDHYPSALVGAIEAGIPNDIDLDVTESRENSSETLTIHVRNTRLDRETTVEVEIYMPYRDVRVDGRHVSRPTISNSTDEVLESLSGLIGSQPSQAIDDVDDLLYDLVALYAETRGQDDRSLVYFDDLIKFCLAIPGISDIFRRPKQSAEEGLRRAFGSQELKRRLERAGSTYHRSGTDPYTGVKIGKEGKDRYVAVEIQVEEL